jgi:hypothetical protein
MMADGMEIFPAPDGVSSFHIFDANVMQIVRSWLGLMKIAKDAVDETVVRVYGD